MKAKKKRPRSIVQALRIVADVYGIREREIITGTNHRERVEARRMVFALVRKYAKGITLLQLRDHVAGSNHATILHAVEAFDEGMAVDALTRKYWREARRQYLEWLDPDRLLMEERIEQLEARVFAIENKQGIRQAV